jgi:hypothetical protein
MPWVGFESTIPASERAKTVHALDRAATVISDLLVYTFGKETFLYFLTFMVRMLLCIIQKVYNESVYATVVLKKTN